MLTVLHGHVLTKLREMASESVHCFITSPPYFGLRNYQTPPQIWGGNPDCKHRWGAWNESHEEREASVSGKSRTTNRSFGGDATRKFNGNHQKHTAGSFCKKCDAWLGHLGLEPNPELYVRNLVAVLREARRVLRKEGVLFLNLGDSYARSPERGVKFQAKREGNGETYLHNQQASEENRGPEVPRDCKEKDLIGIPWMVAFALRTDGWWLRSRIPWIKRNCMPESTTDRPSTAIEDVFLLSKSERYFYDGEAVKMPYSASTLPEIGEQYNGVSSDLYEEALAQNPSDSKRRIIESLQINGGRSRRNSDWFMESWQGLLSNENGDPLALVVNTSPYKEAHFATFPPRLIQPMIAAGTSARGCCSKCGAPWERLVDTERSFESGSGRAGNLPTGKNGNALQGGGETLDVRRGPVTHTNTIGWIPTCKCGGYRVRSTTSRRMGPKSDSLAPHDVDPNTKFDRNGNAHRVSMLRDSARARGYEYGSRPTAAVALDRRRKWYRERWQERINSHFPKVIPCTVCDPFGGSGTTGEVALELGRSAVLIELNEKYLPLIERRCDVTPGLALA